MFLKALMRYKNEFTLRVKKPSILQEQISFGFET